MKSSISRCVSYISNFRFKCVIAVSTVCKRDLILTVSSASSFGTSASSYSNVFFFKLRRAVLSSDSIFNLSTVSLSYLKKDNERS
jgi:hypothetical protein